MLDATDVPEWVPAPVGSMASVFPIGGLNRARLLTDPKMKTVWQYLARSDVRADEDYIYRLRDYRRLASYDVDELKYSTKDIAMAALFAFSANVLSKNLPFIMDTGESTLNRSELSGTITKYHEAADLCRSMIAFDNVRLRDPDFAESLSAVATYLADYATATLAPQMEDAAFIEQAGKTDEARVRAQIIGQETRRLFGTSLNGIVATIVNVGLSLTEHPISRADVQYWLGSSKKESQSLD